MTFLPIVERELRVATRRRMTYWLRVIAAGVALIIGSGMLLLTLVPFAGPMPGSVMFGVLTWMSLAVALSSGLFFTSDCLSEEKREGTLGFLFLTDLRGYDVVLGKLLAMSLRSVFPLLAIFPILAMTLLIGGVEVGHFWRAMLAIANAALFSLATGMFVSVISRHSLKALAGTLVLLILFVGFGPFVDSLGAFVKGSFMAGLSLVSPGYAFVSADYAKAFWPALMANQLMTCLLLALSCFLVRRTWQEKPTSGRPSRFSTHRETQAGWVLRNRQRRLHLLEKNPVIWLAAREQGHTVILWILAAMMLGSFLILLLTGASNTLWRGLIWINNLISLALYLWVAAKACQFFAEARRSGALELLLGSPLTSRETVQGAWQGLLRLFAIPVLLLLCLQLATGVFTLKGAWTTVGNGFGWLQAVAIVLNALVPATNLIAVAWFGLWMGLTSKNTLTATLKTIAFVQIIPWFAIYFLTAISAPLFMLFGGWPTKGNAPSQTTIALWWPLLFILLPATLGLLKNYFFWFGVRKKLFSQFRLLATRSVVPIHTTTLPPIIKAVS